MDFYKLYLKDDVTFTLLKRREIELLCEMTRCTHEEEMPSECHRELTKSRREMDPEGVGVRNPPHSPSADRVSSAADAMLRLSTVPMFIVSNQAQVSSVAPVTPIGEPQVVAMANSMANTMPQVVTTQTTIPQVCIANLPPVDEDRNTGNISSEDGSTHRSFLRLSRKQREFIPEPSKDEQYWLKRRKNNEAAKRSREKRRINDVVMGQRIMELTNERNYVQQELERVKKHFDLPLDKVFRPSGPETPSHSGSTSEGSVLNAVPTGASRTPVDINIPQIMPVSVANHLTHMQRSHQAVTTALTSTYKSNYTDTDTQQQQQQHFYPQTILPPAVPRIVDERSVSTSGIMTSLPNPPVCTTQPHQHLPMVDSTTLPHEQQHQQHHQPLVPAQLYSGAQHHHPQQQHHQQQQHQPQHLHQQSQQAYHQGSMQPIHIFPKTTLRNTEPNDAADFHSQMKVPDICEPISPASSSSTTPDLTISLSAGSSSENSDVDHSQLRDLREAPLNLSTRQVMASGTNRGTNSTNTTDWGIPLKLRYKAANYEYELEQEQEQEQEHNNSHTDCSSRSSCCSIQEFHVGSSVGGESGENCVHKKSGEPTTTKYVERRKKNNFAARKCRENRRFLCNMKIMKSAVLESENQQLRDEMRTLAGEVHELKELIEQKKDAASKGEPFDLPPVLESMSESSDKKPVL